MVRPSQVYQIAVNILHSPLPIMVHASIQRNGVEIAATYQEIQEGIPEKLMMKMPPTSVPGDYRLRVDGNYNSLTGGQAFSNDTQLVFSQRSMTIFIQCDKPVYMQGQTIRVRTIPINTELKAFDGTVEVHILNPQGRIMRRWLSRQSNLGSVSLSYQLSDQPVFGEWRIKVIAQGQVEEQSVFVEEYYQTRFEVNVTMPAFFFENELYIHGIVQANYTSGAPVRGNLTLKASFKPINKYRQTSGTFENVPDRYFTFDEYYPSWFNPFERFQESVPVLRFFNGTYKFRYPMSDLLQYVPTTAEGVEVQVTATVGEHFLEEVIVGYSTARIYNSSVKIHFAGGSPQVFKPGMPFDLNLVASFHDSSPLRPEQLQGAQLELRGDIETRSSGRRSLDSHSFKVSPDNDAIWSLRIDLREQLYLPRNSSDTQHLLNDIITMRFFADFRDAEGHTAHAELLMLAHESPGQKHIKVWTSTEKATVGEYLVLHVQTNFYIESFNYLITSKGSIVLTGDELMQQTIKTFAMRSVTKFDSEGE
ncbi:CD109 antigen-like [Copidosoma floridanum]|uniref:CD109 antigen-like n=1 Tax=Copidosoma floridanum TaxID=29053 RepID=UPI000C6F812F|nr:CD109 antigen-like [Copidosoma floridanum]